MLDPLDPDWINACHEAGHAVAAHLLGVPTEEVFIRKGGTEELGFWTAASKFDRAAMAETWPNYAIVGRMGRQVEVMLFGRYEPRFLEEDDDNIERYLLTFLPTEEERSAFRLRLPRMAEEVALRPGFIEAVVALAKKLMDGEHLKDEEAAAIIDASLTIEQRGEARTEDCSGPPATGAEVIRQSKVDGPLARFGHWRIRPARISRPPATRWLPALWRAPRPSGST
jgi:hypothetical protein